MSITTASSSSRPARSTALAAVPGPPGDRKPAVGCEHGFERGEKGLVVFGDEDAIDGGVLQSLSKLAGNRPTRPARRNAVPGTARAMPGTGGR